MSEEKDKVLVTGSEGYIGSNLVKKLEKENIDCVGYDLRNDEREDVRNKEYLKRKAEGTDLCYHLAAQVGVPQCEAYPKRAFEINVTGIEKVLDICDEVVFASSFAAQKPISLYGATKLAGEKLVLDNQGVVCRFSNVYGGSNFLEEKHTVITKFLEAKMEGRKAEIYGDGKQTRDFVHVEDIVSSLLNVGKCSGAHNVCTGEQTSVLELAEMIGVDYVHKTARENDIRHSGGEPSPVISPKHDLEEWMTDFLGEEKIPEHSAILAGKTTKRTYHERG